jgi:flagellar basal body-associated protein FliL
LNEPPGGIASNGNPQMCIKSSLFLMLVFAIFLIAIAAGIAVIWLNSSEKSRFFRMAPADLGVSKVIYVREESWVFGPGGNDEGALASEH